MREESGFIVSLKQIVIQQQRGKQRTQMDEGK
jgi:hypothetical protein